MKKPKITGILSMLAILMVVSVGSVAAYGYGMAREKGMTNEEIFAAVEAGDFETWKELRTAELTEERFEEVQERHANREIRREGREEIRAAMEAGDYETWKELVEGLEHYPHDIETITESDFEILSQMHQARAEGDHESAQDLAESLGWEFEAGRGKMKGQGRGMHSGMGMRN